ncbi:hypothetical protein RND81_02G222000 [Saponaria officinalis]|uniref:F-box protein n=1 Tax=Saponaria officinalis TaxID=3572 RepID=A0AAW1MSG4_SAPOF
MVVRFCFHMRIVEVYCSVSCMWRNYPLKLDDEFMSSVSFQFQNYVSLFESGVLSLYVLTQKGCGIAIKFKGCVNSEVQQFCFPLPLPEVIGCKTCLVRIWECEETLYLIAHTPTGVWIWKAGSTQVDTWAWVPVFEISPARQLCKPAARKHLSNFVLDDCVRFIPLAFHPNFPVWYLAVESSMFAYNLNTDSLERIGEVKDLEHRSLYFVHTYKPCLNFMDASNKV